jgi:hypothetical protein
MLPSRLTKHRRRPSGRTARRAQAGVVAVEFALTVGCFLLLVFGVIELARALYLWNALQEVTRRAARGGATTSFIDPTALGAVRLNALSPRNTDGTMLLGAPVTEAHVRIDYLWLQRNADGSLETQTISAGLPGCPARNLVNCINNPYSATCIRFVRARVCQPIDAANPDVCNPVPYAPFSGLINWSINLPTALTIVKAETLGYQPGDALCI